MFFSFLSERLFKFLAVSIPSCVLGLHLYFNEFSLPRGDDLRDDTPFSHLHHI